MKLVFNEMTDRVTKVFHFGSIGIEQKGLFNGKGGLTMPVHLS